jgi:cytoskeletal protein RodZ
MLPTPAINQSIGKQLHAGRTARGLSIEDVAFKTHIPAARISELENDDFSNFANLTYAKGFLKIYSNFLSLDLSEYLDQFNTSEFANISGHDYIQSANTGLTSLSMAVAQPEQGGRSGSLWGIGLMVATLVGVPLWYWYQAGKEEEAATAKTLSISEPAPKPKIIAPAEETPAPTNLTPAAPTPSTSGEGTPPPATTPAPTRPVEIMKPAVVRPRIISEEESAEATPTPTSPQSSTTPGSNANSSTGEGGTVRVLPAISGDLAESETSPRN